MAAFLSLLGRWGTTLNLTSAASQSDLPRHVDDSLTLLTHLPAGLDRLIDLGSGQGFPAIPLAIATGVHVDLIESDKRKAAFLTTVLAHLQLSGAVWSSRIEVTVLPRSRCVTARALAPVAQLVRLARPFVTPDGVCLFLKGPSAATEVESAQQDASFAAEIIDTPLAWSRLVKIRGLG